MAFSTKLQKTFYEDLKKNSFFDEAVKLVRNTYKLEVVVNKSKTEFEIKADGIELLDFVQTLLEAWLERKKKKQSDKFEDRNKVTKENPFSDISDGHVVWVFWGDLASKLSSEKYRAEVEKLKLVQQASVSVTYKKRETVCITCNFQTFKDVKSKVESLQLLVASGRHDLDKLQIPDSNDAIQTDGSKDNARQDGEDGEIKVKDQKGTSEFKVEAHDDKQNKSVKSETSTDNGKNLKQSALRQSEGASGSRNLSPPLEGSDSGSDQSSHSSGSKDKRANDDKLLFCTPYGRTKVFVYEASIVNLSGIDAIVNAANDHLSHGAGVAYHISKAAGGDKSQLEEECQSYIKKHGKLEVTKNFTSSAGDMTYKGVIHAVVPIWSDYTVKEKCAKDLCETIKNVLVEANRMKFSEIALPAISSGIYGVPRRLCAEMYIRGVIEFDSGIPQTCVREIHFVDIKKDILQQIRDAYGRWKQDKKSMDFKNANHYSPTSGRNSSSRQHGHTMNPEGSSRQIPSASQYQRSREIHTFKLSKTTSVKVYKCSILEVSDVDAIACAVNPDFSIENRRVAKLIRQHAGHDYEMEFVEMISQFDPQSKEDVLICGAGKLAETQKIKYVIHNKLGKIEKLEDIHRIKHLYIQTFEIASRKKMLKIALPLIGAANLQHASNADIQHCSQLFVKSLKEVVEGRGTELSVQEVHLVDLDENIIKYVVKAFQEQDTANHEMPDKKGGSFRKPVSKQTQGKPKNGAPRSGNGEGRLATDGMIDPERNCPICMDVLTKPECLPCGHNFHANCIKQSQQNQPGCPICETAMKKTTKEKACKGGSNTQSEEIENCPICMDVLTKSSECLPCGHNFHADCIKQSLQYKPACPICGTVMGQLIGNQPEGKMSVDVQDYSLPGHEDCKTIEIFYDFPGGHQLDIHPHPGRLYTGTRRRAFLPNNSEGKKVLELLKVAFDRKLIFTIGESRTTGKTDTVTWNDIHHKTKRDGGPTNFGYPDKTYLSRVQEELAAKGVTEKDIEDSPGCMIS